MVEEYAKIELLRKKGKPISMKYVEEKESIKKGIRSHYYTLFAKIFFAF